MLKRFVSLASFSLLAVQLYSQDVVELGAEYIRSIGKGYNNAKAAVRGETFSNSNSFSAGITYQLGSSKSYSVSSGLGVYVGYRYSFGNNTAGNKFFGGARILFSLENFEGQSRDNSLFITPWAEAGYHFVFAKRIFTSPSIGYGYTKKISKDYKSLDEDSGGRLIPSLSAGYRF